MGSDKQPNGDGRDAFCLDSLLDAISNPSSSDHLDRLAKSLGIDHLSTKEEAIEQVEEQVLSPPKDLSGELWRWQMYAFNMLIMPCIWLRSGGSTEKTWLTIRQAPIELPIPPLPLSPFPATHQILPTHTGIDGTFSHWRPALAPRPPAHPALSSSASRAFGDSKNFVRGKGSYAPFMPGGLNAVAIQVAAENGDDEDEEEEEEDGWKTRAPGLRRGVQLDGAEEFMREMLGQEGLGGKAKRKKRQGWEDGELEVSKLGEEEHGAAEAADDGEGWRGQKGVDDLLPIGVRPSTRNDVRPERILEIGVVNPDMAVSESILTCSAFRHLPPAGNNFAPLRRKNGHTWWTSTRN